MPLVTDYAVMTSPTTSGILFHYAGATAPIQWHGLPPGKLADILEILRHPNAAYNPTQGHLFVSRGLGPAKAKAANAYS